MPYPTLTQVDQSQPFNCLGCPNFNSFNGSRGRGLCTYHNQIVFEHHQSTDECISALIKASTDHLKTYEFPEDIPYSEFEPGQIVKVIDEKEQNHNEWASFVVVTKIINSNRFKSTGSYLEPDWLFLLSSLDQDGGKNFWVAENKICHPEQSHLIDTSEVF